MVGVGTVCWLVVAGLGVMVSGDYRSNSRDVCRRDPGHTAASPTSGDNGFRIKFAGKPLLDKYTPRQVYTVIINGSYPEQRLEGFMLVVVPVNARDESTQIGTFQHFNSGLTRSSPSCPWVATHTHLQPKAGIQVLWTAPDPGAGCVEFRGTVVEKGDVWYKDDGALTKVLCEQTGTTDSSAQELIPDCCACGTGKYQMTFHGLWSRQTHPKDWPQYPRLLHWSNLVGASHSKEYMIWQYGAYASKGIKEVCEYGYPRTLEQEMRQHSRDVRTVIKTPGIWWSNPNGLRQTRWARFSVDRRNHLLTMLTMLGPSPDWCVGVTALNLCLPNCTWAGDMSIDLYPWDAGTDDGVTYMSRNIKSDPPQKIHKITNRFPNSPASPFFLDSPLKPLATLTLRRIHPKPGATVSCNGNETDVEDEGEDFDLSLEDNDDKMMDKDLTPMEKKKRMRLQSSGKCTTSEWTDWSECSVTCGVGSRFRKRTFVNSMMTENMCGIALMATENCIGIENECETADAECAVTNWSDWSPCSVTCSKGIKERRRYYLRQMDMKKCSRQTEERDVCMSQIADCQEALAMKNFTAICALPKDPGPCRGRFIRYYYDSDMNKCLEFIYRGCRGNNNRFRSLEECQQMCEEHMGQVLLEQEMRRKKMTAYINIIPGNTSPQDKTKFIHIEEPVRKDKPKSKIIKHRHKKGKEYRQIEEDTNNHSVDNTEQKDHTSVSDAVDCMVTEWTDWSPCSATCGKSFKYKRRIIKREPENGGLACPKKLERKKRCKEMPTCPMDCELSPWSEWTSCTKTCGEDSIRERARQVVHNARRGGAACGPRLERRYCLVDPCPSPPKKISKQERLRLLDIMGEDNN